MAEDIGPDFAHALAEMTGCLHKLFEAVILLLIRCGVRPSSLIVWLKSHHLY